MSSRYPLGTIMVHLPSVDTIPRLMNVAAPIARSHSAHLVGLHLIPRIPPDVVDPLGGEWLSMQMQRDNQIAEEIGTAFDRAASAEDLAYSWLQLDARDVNATQLAVRTCRNADLVVASQASDDLPSYYRPEDIVLGAGRPVLVVPTAGNFGEIGNNVLIAWNGSREAARAAFDTLPLIQKGAKVQILSVNAGHKEPGHGLVPGDALARTLARHGLNVEAMTSRPDRTSVGGEILNRASDLGSDLIVMGCYGHSRLRETVFGGATQSIVDQMTVPILMSH
ncbi:universal stress protein [Afifella pfennigii]|uniref:universal stress protein n=1 Tax=Afifella pfennigii TaxID=209897 RepID=UPI00047DA1F8|nr:universal stress protein [Afifella pfennigii]